MQKLKYIATVALLFAIGFQGTALAASASTLDLTTKYRVYQNNQILMEYSVYNKAVAYANNYTNSHVEEIASRKWLWDNYPRYKVYQYDRTLPNWQFHSLEQAIKEAKKWGHASVRDLQSSGWAWDNYSRNNGYRLYQREVTLDSWEFKNLEAAKKEATKWSNSHIIDLNSNLWIWDNVTEAKKQEARAGTAIYQMYIEGFTDDDSKYAYLEDAIAEASKWDRSSVVNTAKNNVTVYSNTKAYIVQQNHQNIKELANLDDAIQYAKKWAHASVHYNNLEIWNNYAYYQVYQNNVRIGEFTNIPAALSYAKKYANASIRSYDDGITIWDNIRKLQFWSWNGNSPPGKIMEQVSQSQGLDADSPEWFKLKDADGNMEDTSDANTAAWLKERGYAVHPLVQNQFNSGLTTRFLNNHDAQTRFITQLVNRCAELGVNGINVDFESLSGKDRDAYTAFIRQLTNYAHQKKLIVSIDLPRGSVKWNHLTAYDHTQLAGIVDYIITMAYDQYYSGSTTPGSVAGLQWAEEGVQEFLSYGIPRDKLILGIPFYSREWKLDQNGKLLGNSSLLLRNIPDLLKNKNTVSTWDEAFRQYKISYEEDGYTYIFWLEDEQTLKARLDIAKKYDLAGVAAWRLGHENAEIWTPLVRVK